MRVTDEMVAAAMAAFEAYFQDPAHERQCDECNGEGCTPVGVDADRDWCPKCGGPGTLNDATEEGGIRASLEAALSHASGQEAEVSTVYWKGEHIKTTEQLIGVVKRECEAAIDYVLLPDKPSTSAGVWSDD